MSFEDRRAVLDPMLEGLQGTVRLSEMIANDGAALLADACDLGLEGIIAKRLGSPYKPGRAATGVKSSAFAAIRSQLSATSPRWRWRVPSAACCLPLEKTTIFNTSAGWVPDSSLRRHGTSGSGWMPSGLKDTRSK